jgi:hypothetical protein
MLELRVCSLLVRSLETVVMAKFLALGTPVKLKERESKK